MNPVSSLTPPDLLTMLKQGTEVLNQAIDRSVATNKPMEPVLATQGSVGTQINTYA